MSLKPVSYFQRAMRLSGGCAESVMMQGLVIDMEEARQQTIEQVRAFLEGATEIAFRVPKAGPVSVHRAGAHAVWLCRTGTGRHGGVAPVSGAHDGAVTPPRMAHRHAFPRRFTATDGALLAETDALHSTLSGPTTKKLMERALLIFGDARVERLAGISVSHLYNLRGGTPYQRTRRHWTKTRPTGVPIGQRRAPQPNGRPGYLRIDRVHQGDPDGGKGGYHINAVDRVTQFQLVATCEKISEAYLLPVLRQLLEECPFVILGFPADNGSEYINDKVALLLETWRIACTTSRPGIPTTTPW